MKHLHTGAIATAERCHLIPIQYLPKLAKVGKIRKFWRYTFLLVEELPKNPYYALAMLSQLAILIQILMWIKSLCVFVVKQQNS